MDKWSPVILTLVTFIPLAGALLLLLLPRRDRDIRVFSLVISLFTFVSVIASARTLPPRRRPDFSMNSTALGFRCPIFTITWGWMASPCGWWC